MRFKKKDPKMVFLLTPAFFKNLFRKGSFSGVTVGLTKDGFLLAVGRNGGVCIFQDNGSGYILRDSITPSGGVIDIGFGFGLRGEGSRCACPLLY